MFYVFATITISEAKFPPAPFFVALVALMEVK